MTDKKRVIFTLSPGRCGTRYLSEILGSVPDIDISHEPSPNFADVAQLAQFVPDAARWFLDQKKLPHIMSFPNSTYIETGHVFINTFAEALLGMGVVADLIVLTRTHREVALSRWRRGSIPGRTPNGKQYTIHPNAPDCILKMVGWEQLTDYQLCYWFCLEVAARSFKYALQYESAGATIHRTTLDEITTEQGFLRLVKAFDLPEPDMDAYRRLAAEPSNVTEESVKRIFPEGDLNEQEQGVRDLLQQTPPTEDDARPSVYIFLANTGSIREELSAWRDEWVVDERYKVKVRGSRGFPVTENRNRAVLEFIESGYDYMVMVDEDVVPTRNILDLVEKDLDILAFPTPIWRPSNSPKIPMLLNVTLRDDDGNDIDGVITIGEHKEMMPISSGGTGCIMIARRVLVHPEMRHPFRDVWRYDGPRKIGNDIWFVRRAIEAGFKAWAPMRYPCKHFKSVDLLQVQLVYDELLREAAGGENGLD